VEIVEVTERDPLAKDPSWYGVMVAFKQGEKTINHFLFVPTLKLSYGPTETYSMFHKLRSFLSAFGVDLTKENAGSVIEAIFTDPTVLVGLRANLVIHYEAYSAVWVSKDLFHLYAPDGKPVCDDDKAPLTFISREAAQNHCEEKMKKNFSKFPSIKYTNEPSTANTRKLPTERVKKAVKLDLS
jgi:hypothetical protein